MSQALRSALMAGVMGTALFGCASPSYAIFHWFCPQGSSTYSASRSTYAPPYLACYAPAPWVGSSGCAPCAAPATGCAPCAAPRGSCAPVQTAAYYVPQTCYRPVMTAVPVTTYRPVSASNPCTGCATTYYRPATTWVRQVQYVPYTSYSIRYGSPCYSGACGTSCATGACGSGISYGGTTSSGCSSCARGAAPAANSTLTPTPQPSLNTPSAGSNAPAASGAPASGGTAPSASPPQTFRGTDSTKVDPRAKPIQSSTPARMPELVNPKNPGPTAARPVYQAAYYLVSGTQTAAEQPVVDVNGWHQARD